MPDLVRFSLSIEKPLFEKLETLIETSDYTNRSEFIRDLIRNQLVSEEWSVNKETIGTISIIYDHHSRGLPERLTELQHHFSGKVLASTHIHLDEHLCSEMIMVRGLAADIKLLTNQLGKEKGVLHSNLAMGSTGKRLHN